MLLKGRVGDYGAFLQILETHDHKACSEIKNLACEQ